MTEREWTIRKISLVVAGGLVLFAAVKYGVIHF